MMAREGGSSEEIGSLWIDYVLLPSKLDEHLASLAAGTVTTPSSIDLIVMFLEQAIVTHKTISCSTYGNSVNTKELEAPGALSNFGGKTAVLLCERAAKVAVDAQLTLSDIESIPSRQHQFLLLKALIKHDKIRPVVHECDLHRWLIHNALQSQTVGFTSPNAVSPAASLSSWVVGDDSHLITATGTGDIPTSGSAGASFEEEKTSVVFLENALLCEGEAARIDCAQDQMAAQDSEVHRISLGEGVSGYGLTNLPSLSEDYKCQIMLDIAEVHFMRGRIWKAHDTFTSCGQLLAKFANARKTSCGDAHSALSQEQSLKLCKYMPVPRDRLAGFIIACRMILGMHVLASSDKKKVELLKAIDMNEPPLPYLDSPSPAEQAIIACEQIRWLVRYGAYPGFLPANSALPGSVVNSVLSGSIEPKETIFKDQDRTGCREPPIHQQSGLENSQGHLSTEDRICSILAEYVVASELEHISGEDFPLEKMEKGSPSLMCSSKTNKFIQDHRMVPSETVAHKCLSQLFMNDLLKGDLTWGYRFSLEKDPSIPVSIRCQLIACNALQSILSGAPLESFLRISEHFDCNKVAVDFLMKLIAVVLTRLEGKDDKRTGVELYAIEQLYGTALIKSKKRRIHEVDAMNKEVLVSRLHQFVKYVCCVLDKPWCWTIAQDLHLLSDRQAHRLRGSAMALLLNPVQEEQEKGTDFTTHSQRLGVSGATAAVRHTTLPPSSKSDGKRDLVNIFQLMQAERLDDHKAILSEAKLFGSSRLQEETLYRCIVEDVKKLDPDQVSEVSASGGDIEEDSFKGSLGEGALGKCAVSVLRRKAFGAVKTGKQYRLAMHLYNLARLLQPEDTECHIMLWLLERLTKEKGEEMNANAMELPKRRLESLPTLELLEYVLQKLIEEEFWIDLSELCKWLASLINQSLDVHDGLVKPGKLHANTFGSGARKVTHLLKVATALGKLMTFCSPLKATLAYNSFSEDIAHLALPMWQLFEDLLYHLADVDGTMPRDVSVSQVQGFHQTAMMSSSPYTGAKMVPLISRISNPKVLMCLASLTAGWLQRCHVARLTPWPLDVERYGVLAGIMAGASLSPPVGPSTASIHRNVSLLASPDAVRDIFRMLLERIVDLPNVVEQDRDKGHCWLQGLADLAFEDDDHIKALQYYLQAGAIRSACYCSHRSSMPRDIFTPWVIGRMIRACRALGAGLQGAVLCQCLPIPDYDLAFRILQESLVIMDQDMDLYSECLWEVPILELLIHMHTKAGDESRVNSLICLLQQPALNVHNPSSIRKSHVDAMEQRFLQRFYEEIH